MAPERRLPQPSEPSPTAQTSYGATSAHDQEQQRLDDAVEQLNEQYHSIRSQLKDLKPLRTFLALGSAHLVIRKQRLEKVWKRIMMSSEGPALDTLFAEWHGLSLLVKESLALFKTDKEKLKCERAKIYERIKSCTETRKRLEAECQRLLSNVNHLSETSDAQIQAQGGHKAQDDEEAHRVKRRRRKRR